MRILFLNNHGGGFASHIDVAEGTSVAQLFAQQMPGCRPDDFLIRVDRMPATADQVLTEGQRISATPVKIEGAVFAATSPAAA
jgi:hypothetical protein